MNEFKGTKENWHIDINSCVHSDNEYQEIKGGEGYYDKFNIDSGFSITGFISNSNANLILAAPDLLQACVELIKFTSEDKTHISRAKLVELTNKAINKALGK